MLTDGVRSLLLALASPLISGLGYGLVLSLVGLLRFGDLRLPLVDTLLPGVLSLALCASLSDSRS